MEEDKYFVFHISKRLFTYEALWDGAAEVILY